MLYNNTNVRTNSNGYIMGGSGGHSDATAGVNLLDKIYNVPKK